MKVDLNRRKRLEQLQENLSIKFVNLDLLNRALTHTSYNQGRKDIPHNQRLEFLGDAVLELVTAEYLFRRYPHLNEGDLSKLRSRIVSEENLSRYARKVKVGKYLLIGKDQEGIQSQNSLLADAYEAIIGAFYLDKGLEATSHFLWRLFAKEEERIEKIGDYKSRLQEYTQSVYKSLPQYEVTQEIGPDHGKRFKVKVKVRRRTLGEGWGSSKKRAEKMAAQSAWRKIADTA